MTPPIRVEKKAPAPPAKSVPTETAASVWERQGQGNQAVARSLPVGAAVPPSADFVAWVDQALSGVDPVARSAAIMQLMMAQGEAAWRELLLAQTTPDPAMRTEVDGLIRYRLETEPAFEIYVRELAANPQGALSDLAIRALTAVGGGAVVDTSNYIIVIGQRLAVARGYLADINDRLYVLVSQMVRGGLASTGELDTSAIDDLEGKLYTLPLDDLWEVGLRASTLLVQLGKAREAATELQTAMSSMAEDGAVKKLVANQLLQILLSARHLTGAEDDPAFVRIAELVSSWPGRFAETAVNELYNQFVSTRKDLDRAMTAKPFKSFENAWIRFVNERLVPLRDDLDTLILELEFLKPEAKANPDLAFGQLQALEVPIRALGDKVLFALQAENMMQVYNELVITDERAADLHEGVKRDLKVLFALFAQLEVEYDKDPEEAQRVYKQIVESKEFADVMQQVQDWEEILAGEDALMHFLLDVAIIIAAAYTGGWAAGLVRGFFGEAVTLGGRIAVGSAAFGAEVTTFTVTSRGLRRLAYGEEFLKGFGGDLARNALLFGILKGTGAAYARFGAPRLPAAWRPIGGMTATFAAFQAWTVGLHYYETKEWIGVTNPKFWKLAAQNAVFLGAVHLGMGISKPLVAPIESRVLGFQVARHNQRCQDLEARMRMWENAETPDFDGAVQITRRAQALYRERLDLMKEINRNDPSDLSAEELQRATDVIEAQVQAAENALFLSRFNVTAHESAPNVFYYEGGMEEFRAHYERQGFEVLEADASSGRLRLRSPEGEIVDMIRTRLEPTGAGRGRGGKLEAEDAYEQIRASETDVAGIAGNTGIPERVVRRVKNHLFLRAHRVAVGPGKIVEMRFTPDSRIAELWSRASAGPLETAELAEFRRLLAHEYVESSLMARGLPYHSADPAAWQSEAGEPTYWPTAQKYGAHDLAPLVDPGRSPFEHWRTLFKMPVTLEQARKLGVPIEDWMDVSLEPSAEEAPEALRPESAREAERKAMEESQAWWRTPGTTTDVRFARHQQTFTSIAGTLRNARTVLDAQGRGNLLPRFDDTVLRMPVDEFIRRRPDLRSRWAELARRARGSPELQFQMQEFLEGRIRGGGREVGARQPDLVEFFLDRGEIVVTDVTTAIRGLHVFKTAFYRAVLDAMVGGGTGPQIYGLDIDVSSATPVSVVIP